LKRYVFGDVTREIMDVSEEYIASIINVKRIGEVETTSAVTTNEEHSFGS
jgi:hypothetical protein